MCTCPVTYVDIDALPVEDGGLGVVCGDVSVELLAVPIPLDGVQLVSLHVIVADQLGIVAPHRVVRNLHFDQFDAACQS